MPQDKEKEQGSIEKKPEKETVIFFARGENAKYNGFRREEKYPDGTIKTPDIPITFTDNQRVTDDPDEIAFLRDIASGKKAQIAGEIVECKDMNELEQLKAGRKLRRHGLDSVSVQHAITGKGEKNDNKISAELDIRQ